MKKVLEFGTSDDKRDWFSNHVLTKEQRQKLIEDKVQRYLNQIEFDKKARRVLKAR